METIEQQARGNLKSCLDKCSHGNGPCYSVAFNALCGEFLFFSRTGKETQLAEDTASDFVHYELNWNCLLLIEHEEECERCEDCVKCGLDSLADGRFGGL